MILALGFETVNLGYFIRDDSEQGLIRGHRIFLEDYEKLKAALLDKYEGKERVSKLLGRYGSIAITPTFRNSDGPGL